MTGPTLYARTLTRSDVCDGCRVERCVVRDKAGTVPETMFWQDGAKITIECWSFAAYQPEKPKTMRRERP